LKILDDLKGLGYSISLEGSNIRLRYLGIGSQPSEAGPLIEELKARKAAALAYLEAQGPLTERGSLVPYTVNSYSCPGCGKALEVFYPQGALIGGRALLAYLPRHGGTNGKAKGGPLAHPS